MRATVDSSSNVVCVIFWVPGSRVNSHCTSVSVGVRAEDSSPEVGSRACLDHSPARRCCMFDRTPNVLVRVVGQLGSLAVRTPFLLRSRNPLYRATNQKFGKPSEKTHVHQKGVGHLFPFRRLTRCRHCVAKAPSSGLREEGVPPRFPKHVKRCRTPSSRPFERNIAVPSRSVTCWCRYWFVLESTSLTR